eukprot:g6773.t1
MAVSHVLWSSLLRNASPEHSYLGRRKFAVSTFLSVRAHSLTPEAFSNLLTSFDEFIDAVFKSGQSEDIRLGIQALEDTISVKHLIGDELLQKFLKMLMTLVKNSEDRLVTERAAHAIGILVSKSGGALSNKIESKILWAMGCLEASVNFSIQKLNAALFLKSIAEQAPAAFNVHVQKFLSIVWNGLKDTNADLRIASAQAVGACLSVIEQRETRNRVQWFHFLANEAIAGLHTRSNTAWLHGSLLVVSELLRYSGEFMLARYEEVCRQTFLLRSHKDIHVIIAVLHLIPRLAEFCPERFVHERLVDAITIILPLSHEGIRIDCAKVEAAAFRALKGLALSMEELGNQYSLKMWIQEIAEKLMMALEKKVKCQSHQEDCRSHQEALDCCGVLAQCLKSDWKPFAESLLLPMVMTGLSSSLASCLQKTLNSIPELASTIRKRLLDVIYIVLINEAFTEDLSDELQDKIRSFRSTESVISALEILSSFDFSDQNLLSFALDHITSLASGDESWHVRAAAIKASGLIAKQHCLKLQSCQDPSTKSSTESIHQILEHLISCGISDSKECVRYTVWYEFCKSPELDTMLMSCNSVTLIHVGFGDASLPVQLNCLKVTGRLLQKNQPHLHSTVEALVLQLIQKLDLLKDNERNQINVEILGQVIQSCPTVIFPRLKIVSRSLVTLLSDQLKTLDSLEVISDSSGGDDPSSGGVRNRRRVAFASTGVISVALKAIGHLADQSGQSMDSETLQRLLELTVKVLQNPEIEKDSIEAVRTLGKIISSTGMATRPYHQFAWLLPRLLDMLQIDDYEVRMITARTLGVLCAIDPSMQRRIQAQASGEGRLELEGVRPVKRSNQDRTQSTEKASLTETLSSFGAGIDSEESYSVIAMSCLLRILKQRSFSNFHRDAISTLGNIIKALSSTSVHYLTKLIPDWCDAVYSGDEEMKCQILEQFIKLITVIDQPIRHYLRTIMKLIKDLWTVNCSKRTLTHNLLLLKEVGMVCRLHCSSYFKWLIPRFVLLLETGEWEMVSIALSTLNAFGPALQEHLHQLLPAILNLLDSLCCSAMKEVQLSVLKSLQEFIPNIHVPELATSLAIPLIRLISSQLKMESNTTESVNSAISVLCSVIYSCRLDSQVLVSLGSFLHHHHDLQEPDFQLQNMDTLMKQMYLMQKDDLEDNEADLTGSWRSQFEHRIESQSFVIPDGANDRRTLFPNRDLQRCWNAEHVYTYQDWVDWMRSFSLNLIRMSPSPALRACHCFAEYIPNIAKDLLPVSFVSCWSELSLVGQRESIRSLEATMAARTIPPEIVTTLLNLAEFMEHNGNELPLDKRTLAALSMKCQAFAKALHYKEMEFQESPNQAVENMLAIYNQCYLPAAASGLLGYARDVLGMQIKDSWYEKLHKWDQALTLYQRRAQTAPRGTLQSIEANLGCMRCYSALWDWQSLHRLCREQWAISDPFIRKQIAPLAAQAAWKMGQWTEMSDYLNAVDIDKDDTADAATCAFLCSVSHLHQKEFQKAQCFIDKARQFLSADLAALSSESYERSYEKMVRVQQLAELEEVMECLQNPDNQSMDSKKHMIQYWNDRLDSVQKRADVWESCLSVRSLLLNPEDDIETWMKFADVCRKQEKFSFAKSMLLKFLGYDPLTKMRGQSGYGAASGKPKVMLAFLKHLFNTSEPASEWRIEAIDRLRDMIQYDNLESLEVDIPSAPLVSRAYLMLAKWQRSCQGVNQTSDQIESLIQLTKKACDFAPSWAKAWRDWAVFHLLAVEFHNEHRNECASEHVAPAVRGFFNALSLSQESALHGGMNGSGPSKDTYQDILRLLTLWFTHGNAPNVVEELTKGFGLVRIETWLVVIPQIIARIPVRASHAHPQALLYPLLVASCPVSGGRRSASLEALDFLRLSYPILVNEGELVSHRLVDLAVQWDEKWHESLEEASRLYFNQSDVESMLSILLPLHQNLQSTLPTTTTETRFVTNYADQLNEAYGLLLDYQENASDSTLRKAWDVYFGVFRDIDRNVRDVRVLHLSDAAPDLLDRSMSVAIPGTYSPFQTEQVCIDRIVPEIQVMKTKQRPRQLTIEGNDGNNYIFLLKGHEDLRQDERVMQLCGLVNTILASNFEASENELSIARYAVTPLSPNVGLIGWVPNCDTLHTLIKEYREVKGIPINSEHQRMKSFAPNCEHLTIIQKVEVFEYALDCISGDDLKNIMWIKSSSSEHWLAHRTNYIRSCAVMSIVGYLLGLGDRHPSNLMIDRYTGKLIHIDFGDCFEAGMHREKFPEKVPFRLTRMMVRAMEVAGVEGTFRTTCELVMQVLRNEKETVMAMLEAFVYDPLINWRFAWDQPETLPANVNPEEMPNATGDAHDLLNERAIEVTNRIKLKLGGRELNPNGHGLPVPDQVDHLIKEATSHVNLCQAYIGWCPFW